MKIADIIEGHVDAKIQIAQPQSPGARGLQKAKDQQNTPRHRRVHKRNISTN